MPEQVVQTVPWETVAALKAMGQEHMLAHWDRMTSEERTRFVLRVADLKPETFRMQREMVLFPKAEPPPIIEPFCGYSKPGDSANKEMGQRLLSQGMMGCLVVAGGQGTRLGFDGPKGLFPVTVIKNKTLFQLVAEKTVAVSRQVGRQLPLAIMTSPINYERTVSYFDRNHLFGLVREQVGFFSQEMLPLLDDKGNLFFDASGCIAEGPNGNGLALQQFVSSGLWQFWWEQGVRYLNFIIIDNPLADPFDAELLGFHHRMGGEATVKCTTRRDADEKVGSLVRCGGHVKVIEYAELSHHHRSARNANGELTHPCASISLFCFSMDFVKRVAASPHEAMPWHMARKTVPGLSREAWKFEKYIFDVLPLATSVQALLYPREECFAPLKNRDGADSIATVREMLQQRDRVVFQALTGKEPPTIPFELDPAFYYPTAQLLERAKQGLPLTTSYIES